MLQLVSGVLIYLIMGHDTCDANHMTLVRCIYCTAVSRDPCSERVSHPAANCQGQFMDSDPSNVYNVISAAEQYASAPEQIPWECPKFNGYAARQ